MRPLAIKCLEVTECTQQLLSEKSEGDTQTRCQAKCGGRNLCFPQSHPRSFYPTTGVCEFQLWQQLQEFVKDPLRTVKSTAIKGLFPA